MNYRHAFHAGNFADVLKHVALVSLLMHLARKEKGFCVVDTHAGAGLYHLESGEAARTGEAQNGFVRLAGLVDRMSLPAALASYLDEVCREGREVYPGSPRIAARLLRPQDRLIAIEKQPDEAAALRCTLQEFRNARVFEADGYERLPALLPPRERRGVVLIDPPYESPDEFSLVADILARAHRRFATGVYLVWYPVKSRADPDSLAGEVQTRVAAPFLKIEIDTRRASVAGKERLSAAGILIINPPFGFEEAMKQCAAVIAPLLGHDPLRAANISITSPSPFTIPSST